MEQGVCKGYHGKKTFFQADRAIKFQAIPSEENAHKNYVIEAITQLLDSSTALNAWKYIWKDPVNHRLIRADGAIICCVVFTRLDIQNVAEIFCLDLLEEVINLQENNATTPGGKRI